MAHSKPAGASAVKSACKGSQSISDATHRTAAGVPFSKTKSAVVQVVRKLKCLGEGSGENELLSTAEELVSEDWWLCQFSHLLDLTDVVIEGTEEIGELAHPMEVAAAKERVQLRFDVTTLNLTVCLRPLQKHSDELIPRDSKVVKMAKFLGMEYGGKHAAIIVGNVLLEWNDSHLIRPDAVTGDESFTFESDVKKTGKYFMEIASKRPSPTDPLKPFEEEGELLCQSMEVKEQMIKKIIEVIVKYNSYYYYNSVSRNCQAFVNDVIKAVKITGEKFHAEAQQYLQLIKKGKIRIKDPRLFESHGHLEKFVLALIESKYFGSLKKAELEVLKKRYEQFHGQAVCTELSCSYELVVDALPSTVTES